MKDQTDPREILGDLIDRVRRSGADAADALCFEAVSLSHARRLGEIENLERSESRDLGLRVIIGKRQATVSSTDFSTTALDDLVERGLAMARTVPEDPWCGIADPGQIASSFPDDLEICDPEEPAADALMDRARACEDAARAVTGVTNSEGAEASWSRTRVVLAASNGFTGDYAVSRHSVGVAVLAGEGTGMERDYEYDTRVFAADLRDPAEIGREAGERTVRRLNPAPMATARLPVVYDPRVSGGLLGHLSSAISGAAVARGTSFLKDRMGEALFAEGVTIVDDPHRPRGLRSKAFDGEGLANRRRNIVEAGRLTTWLLDLRSARRLDLAPTGHAARGTSGPPSPSATNLWMEPGPLSPAELIAGIEEGLWINELIGMGVNGVTGDYSRGAAGFRIESGELAGPVSGVTVAGNLVDMFRQLTPASNLVWRYGVDAPTVRIEGMTIAGQ